LEEGKRLQQGEVIIEFQKSIGSPGDFLERSRDLMEAARDLSHRVGVVKACEALAIPRARLYCHRHLRVMHQEHRPPPRALEPQERQEILDLLHSERYVDLAPREIYANFLDEHRYLCSVSAMYRILCEPGEIQERSDQLRHPFYSQPELLATGPNEVWSWAITKPRGPQK